MYSRETHLSGRSVLAITPNGENLRMAEVGISLRELTPDTSLLDASLNNGQTCSKQLKTTFTKENSQILKEEGAPFLR
jgi:hypothetical protein